jgi:hypothetical protein
MWVLLSIAIESAFLPRSGSEDMARASSKFHGSTSDPAVFGSLPGK